MSITAKIMLGTGLLGAIAGTIGCFAVLRRRALVGDMMAHAALPGICLAYIVTENRSFIGLSVGAFIAGVIGMVAVSFICRWTRTKEDAAIGIVLSTFFGLGIVILSRIQRTAGGNQAGLDDYLFGETASMQAQDILVLVVTACVAFGLLMTFYKEFKLLSFDGDFASAQGWPVGVLDLVMMGMLAAVTIVGLPIVGVILMAALLIIPGASARFWTNRLGPMLAASAGFGISAGVFGTWLASASRVGAPPGPLIVLAATSFFVVSLLLAPAHGVVARVVTEMRLRRRIVREHILRTLYELCEPKLPELPLLPVSQVIDYRSWSRWMVELWLRSAEQRGWIYRNFGTIQLTKSGLREAAAVTKTHRLWELYLMEHADIAADHVDRDADDVEHLLPQSLLSKLEARLAETGRLPNVTGVLPSSPHDITIDP